MDDYCAHRDLVRCTDRAHEGILEKRGTDSLALLTGIDS